MSVEGIYKGITKAKKEGNSIEGTGGQKRGQTRNCNLPEPVCQCDTVGHSRTQCDSVTQCEADGKVVN